jgi:hypothetical protein
LHAGFDCLQDSSTVLHLVAKSLLCGQTTQLDMAKAFIQAGANPAALDAVSGCISRGTIPCRHAGILGKC